MAEEFNNRAIRNSLFDDTIWEAVRPLLKEAADSNDWRVAREALSSLWYYPSLLPHTPAWVGPIYNPLPAAGELILLYDHLTFWHSKSHKIQRLFSLSPKDIETVAWWGKLGLSSYGFTIRQGSHAYRIGLHPPRGIELKATGELADQSVTSFIVGGLGQLTSAAGAAGALGNLPGLAGELPKLISTSRAAKKNTALWESVLPQVCFGVRPPFFNYPAVQATFQVIRPVKWGETVCLCGSIPELGAWNPESAVNLRWHQGDIWSREVFFPLGNPEGLRLEYKYLIKSNSNVLQWESGNNHTRDIELFPFVVRFEDSWQG
jgi:hypothetical protein